jgi:hypothetical protein
MNLTLPWRRTRVLAVGCRFCGRMRKPRQVRMPDVICRDCETHGVNQTWTPSAAHLAAAHADAARRETTRHGSLAATRRRTDLTLGGR